MSVASPPRIAPADRAASTGAPPHVPGAPVIVLGGGPIGMLCALLLARAAIRSTLIDARPVEALAQDRRLIALSQGSLQVLESVLGRGFAPLAPIERVLVSSQGEPGRARLSADDFDAMPLGATVWFSDLVRALVRKIGEQESVHTLRPRRAMEVSQHPDLVRVRLDDGTELRGPLCVDAEGTPPVAHAASHHALLAELSVALDRPGDAVERFTREGPLALLPIPGGSDRPSPAAGGSGDGGEGRRMSMIWCLPTALARERMQLPPSLLLALVTQALGARIRPPAGIGAVNAFALHTHRVKRVCEHRVVHLGNAAQTLHPVAGQGFNLGIRDCVSLVDSLRARVPQADCAASDHDAVFAGLREYARRRRLDRRLVPALTSALPRVFAPGFPSPVAALRSATLVAIDLVPPLRRGFARLLMYGPSQS